MDSVEISRHELFGTSQKRELENWIREAEPIVGLKEDRRRDDSKDGSSSRGFRETSVAPSHEVFCVLPSMRARTVDVLQIDGSSKSLSADQTRRIDETAPFVACPKDKASMTTPPTTDSAERRMREDAHLDKNVEGRADGRNGCKEEERRMVIPNTLS